MRNKSIQNSKRVVIKVGTRVLTQSSGKLDEKRVAQLVEQIALLKKKGLEVIVVTSGAVGAGMGELSLSDRPHEVSELQAVAAVGQIRLMHLYHDLFNEQGCQTAQILMTSADFKDQTRHQNAKNTFSKLMDYNVVPLVNENDSVAVEEIRFGDNDHLSVFVTELVEADLLILLTVTDGLLNVDPAKEENATRISEVKEWDSKIEAMAGDGKSELGTGGMKTKLKAAKIVTETGRGVVIADGAQPNVLVDLFEGKDIGTFFVPQG